MEKFISFPDINQYKQTIRSLQLRFQYVGQDENDKAKYDKSIKLPTLLFNGTVKLHGTNASIVLSPDNVLYTQSRKNVITVERDNAGFAFFVESYKEEFKSLLTELKVKLNLDSSDTICIFGEWCGGSIQKNIALNNLEKMFVIFDIKVRDIENKTTYFHLVELCSFGLPSNTYSIKEFETYELNIDLNDPASSTNALVEITNNVEKMCPVGKAFDVVGVGVGEGVVWSAIVDGEKYRFKVKGEKHSSSKVKKLASIDPVKLASVKEFVDYSVTENRLNQAYSELFTNVQEEPVIEKTGNFIKWMVGDICKEEIDAMKDSSLEPKDVISQVSKKSREWFHKRLYSF